MALTKMLRLILLAALAAGVAACATAYKAKPMPFKSPGAYPNAVKVGEVTLGVKAFVDPGEAGEAFGFNIRDAGMLPVQLVFDNTGERAMEINAQQTFLEDNEGNLWPILARDIAYERATRYAQTKETFKEAAYGSFLGAAAGAIIGAAVGIVTGDNVGEAIGKGAAVGAASGATLGGVKGYASDEARRAIINDLNSKTLEQKSIAPHSLAFGFIFFPGEAQSARRLRLQLVETGGVAHTLQIELGDPVG